MANIVTYLKQIMSARRGVDVRDSIHDSIKAINDETVNSTNLSKETQARQNALEKKYDEQIKELANGDPQLPEIVEARQGFDTLGSVIKQKVYHFENVQAMKNCLTLIPRRCVSNSWILRRR